MNTFTLVVHLDNAAFDEEQDGAFNLALLIAKVAVDIQNLPFYSHRSNLMDVNGNTVGHYTIR